MKKISTLCLFSCLLFAPRLHAQAVALLDIQPVLIDFGTIEAGSSATQVFTLSNLTSADLPITGFSASGDAVFDIDVNGGSMPCGSENPTLPPQGDCTMAVTFAPITSITASAGVSFTPNNQPASSINVRFLGEATAPANGGCSLGGWNASGSWFWLFLPLSLGAWFRRRS
ncbi:MAG: choice-of-anchor D domain-containing protein [bacterium]